MLRRLVKKGPTKRRDAASVESRNLREVESAVDPPTLRYFVTEASGTQRQRRFTETEEGLDSATVEAAIPSGVPMTNAMLGAPGTLWRADLPSLSSGTSVARCRNLEPFW